MKKYRVTHNGINDRYFNSYEELEKYIFDTVMTHKIFEPKEIYRGYNADNLATDKSDTIKSVIIWQYSTMYTEVFMIEELEW